MKYDIVNTISVTDLKRAHEIIKDTYLGFRISIDDYGKLSSVIDSFEFFDRKRLDAGERYLPKSLNDMYIILKYAPFNPKERKEICKNWEKLEIIFGEDK